MTSDRDPSSSTKSSWLPQRHSRPSLPFSMRHLVLCLSMLLPDAGALHSLLPRGAARPAVARSATPRMALVRQVNTEQFEEEIQDCSTPIVRCFTQPHGGPPVRPADAPAAHRPPHAPRRSSTSLPCGAARAS